MLSFGIKNASVGEKKEDLVKVFKSMVNYLMITSIILEPKKLDSC